VNPLTSESPSTQSVLALVFGILSWVACPCVGTVAAIALGAGQSDGVGRAGFILGMINLVVLILSFVVFLVVGGIGMIAEAVN